MNKLKLQTDDLRVESFETTRAVKEKGTVVGEQQCTCPTQCTCPGCPTCDQSCNGTCAGVSCAYTCDDSCYYGSCVETCANYGGAQPCTWGKPIACYE
jgi:hypothetical protein